MQIRAGSHRDCVIAGAGFAGLACAQAMAESGCRVTVLEKKSDPGEKLHTTGILVKDAVDLLPFLNEIPPELTRRISGVRLYAPNMQHVDLSAPGYYFLATDTPDLMRWLAERAIAAGAEIRYRTPFIHAERHADGFVLPEIGHTRYLVGADGANSRVAAALGMGRNRETLFGVEYEFRGLQVPHEDRLHCFIDKQLAPGYIGWVVPGVQHVQVGIARRNNGGAFAGHPAPEAWMGAFMEKIAPVFDFRPCRPHSIRAGLIPCGGVVRDVARARALLVGDAAGMVSPVTAGGIHTALHHGMAAGVAIGAFLQGAGEDPAHQLAQAYPDFIAKRLLRYAYDHLQSDTLFNMLLGTRFMRAAAEQIYFHRKGVRPEGNSVRPETFSREKAMRP